MALSITELNMHLARIYRNLYRESVGAREDVNLTATTHQQGEPDRSLGEILLSKRTQGKIATGYRFRGNSFCRKQRGSSK